MAHTPLLMTPLSEPMRWLYRCCQRIFAMDVTWLMVVDKNRLDPTLPAERGSASTTRFLTAQEVVHWAGIPEAELSADMADRLADGKNFCVGTFVGDQLASYAWFALGQIEAEHNRARGPASGVGLSFPAHMAFMYKGFTRSKYRGLGLYRQVQCVALELLASRGVTTILATADWSNRAALVSCSRVGFEPIGRVWVYGLGKWMWRRRPRAAALWGIAAV